MDEFLHILKAYGITMGWAMVGAVSMGLGIIIALKLFTISTKNVDEWELIKNNNTAMAIIMAAIVVGCSAVVAVAILPAV